MTGAEEEESDDEAEDVDEAGFRCGTVQEDAERDVEHLLSQDNELDLIFYNYTRLLEHLREQCLDYGYTTSDGDHGDDDEEEEDEVAHDQVD